MRRSSDSGFGTVEAMVSIGILAIVASTLAHSIAAATRARVASARTMAATEGAVSLVEQLRLGDAESPPDRYGLDYHWSAESIPERPGLRRYSVTAAWQQDRPWKLHIEGLTWRRP